MITERIVFKNGRNVAILRVWRDDGTWSDVEIGRFHDHRLARGALRWAIEELRKNGGVRSGEGAALDLEAAGSPALIQRGRAPGLRKYPRSEDEEIEAPGRIGKAPGRVGQ